MLSGGGSERKHEVKTICTYVETASEQEQRTWRFVLQRAERKGGECKMWRTRGDKDGMGFDQQRLQRVSERGGQVLRGEWLRV